MSAHLPGEIPVSQRAVDPVWMPKAVVPPELRHLLVEPPDTAIPVDDLFPHERRLRARQQQLAP